VTGLGIAAAAVAAHLLRIHPHLPREASFLGESLLLLALIALVGAVATARPAPGPAAAPVVGPALDRPCVKGKFLFVGEEKLYIRGVTYGPFRPNHPDGESYDREAVEHDFAAMAVQGMNAVRVYTVPPRWLLDAAQRHGLRVMVGLPWEQHIAFLEDRRLFRDLEARVRAGVRACAGHPAVLCYVIGNEIPTAIVRWHGQRRVERFLRRLYRAAKAEDPDALVTYVNYPSTEYLQLPFLDFVAFNVYLESEDRLRAYLARLQNLAGNRPLVMAELGLDSRTHGPRVQAEMLDWQVRTAFAAGCAGVVVFAWTDEWHRGGHEVEDWDFGLTDRRRRPKPALGAVRRAFGEAPFPARRHWPRVSVVVCAYNAESTLRDCCEGLAALDYPDYEVIIVDDGSTDRTAQIAQEYGFVVIRTVNLGLSSARNTGLEAATGEIVAYLDSDARPDAQWLTYLGAAFADSDHVGIGGPNVPPAGDGWVAGAVAGAPGNPVHVLLSDEVAEHLPGCNMAFRKSALEAVGGFDTQFRVAGDDVDVCWQLQERGWTLGFSPAALVWHHCRDSVRGYWRQQVGYGRAEAMLERKWPEKYNGLGHAAWQGRLYGNGHTPAFLFGRQRVYHGIWGSAPFQSIYAPAPGLLRSLPAMPEWYLLTAGCAGLSALGLLWRPMLAFVPLFALSLGLTVVRAIAGGWSTATSGTDNETRYDRVSSSVPCRRRLLGVGLHLLQPLARLWGRSVEGLTPWRRRSPGFAFPVPRRGQIWSEAWQEPTKWRTDLEGALRQQSATVRRGGSFDRWDLDVRVGALGSVRTRVAVEEHGAGRQLVRVHAWPRATRGLITVVLAPLALICAAAAWDHAWAVSGIVGLAATALTVRLIQQCGGAMAALLRAVREWE